VQKQWSFLGFQRMLFEWRSNIILFKELRNSFQQFIFFLYCLLTPLWIKNRKIVHRTPIMLYFVTCLTYILYCQKSFIGKMYVPTHLDDIGQWPGVQVIRSPTDRPVDVTNISLDTGHWGQSGLAYRPGYVQTNTQITAMTSCLAFICFVVV